MSIFVWNCKKKKNCINWKISWRQSGRNDEERELHHTLPTHIHGLDNVIVLHLVKYGVTKFSVIVFAFGMCNV